MATLLRSALEIGQPASPALASSENCLAVTPSTFPLDRELRVLDLDAAAIFGAKTDLRRDLSFCAGVPFSARALENAMA